MAWVTPSQRSTGDLITAAIWNQDPVDNVQFLYDNLAMQPIYSVEVGAGGAASIDIQNIPQTFGALKLVTHCRGTSAASLVSLLLRFNNDGGNNYDYNVIRWDNSSMIYSPAVAQSSAFIGRFVAATGTADVFNACECVIPSYANGNVQKATVSHSGHKHGTAVGNMTSQISNNFWRSTAAITRLTLFPSADNFAQYSSVYLYGWMGV